METNTNEAKPSLSCELRKRSDQSVKDKNKQSQLAHFIGKLKAIKAITLSSLFYEKIMLKL